MLYWKDCGENKLNTVCIKKSESDQFYTKKSVAKECYDKVIAMYPEFNYSLFLEPSAGNGSFYNLFPSDKRVGLDTMPACSEIIKQDFFTYVPPVGQLIMTIGNPPFGRKSSIAIKFFNKAAEFSQVIAFIVPRTFKKQSIHNKLDLNFHLKLDYSLQPTSFILSEKPYRVPCCFQIWEKLDFKRVIEKKSLDNKFFSYVKKDNYDLAVRRIGGSTGKAVKDIGSFAPASYYFLKVKDGVSIDWLMNKINGIDFGATVKATAGAKSLSKPELVKLLK